ncbi:MAG: hypothetical protein ILP10_06175 [Lachnospiraceae bacterium]|nr:hypothetical protein [Lachnospiraceae bacterium]
MIKPRMLKKEKIKSMAEAMLRDYLKQKKEDHAATCRSIRVALLGDVNVIIDISRSTEYHVPFDYDPADLAEAPIGVTREDEELYAKIPVHERKKRKKPEEQS